MLAFILIASRLGRPVDAGYAAKCTRYDMIELPFEPDQYLGWHSKDHRLYLFAWQAFSEQGQVGSHWHVDHDQVVLFSGMPIPRDGGWEPGISWAEQLAERVAASGAPGAAAELGGAFDLLHLQAEADSTVINDPLGGAPLYWDASQELLIISNRANLVASVWELPGAPVVRDWRGPMWSLFAGEPLDGDTGLKDVAALEPGGWWELGWKKRPIQHSRPIPKSEDGDPIDRIEAALRASLRSTAALPFQQCSLALDGGKASRLLLALAQSEGLLDRIMLTTTGDIEEPGVQIAAELADRVGRPLVLQTRSLTDPDEFSQQARIASFQSSGVGNLWDMGGLLGSTDMVRIEADLAGLLAPSDRARAVLEGTVDYDPLGLLRPAIASFFTERVNARFGDNSRRTESAIALAANQRAIATDVEVPTIAHAYPYLDVTIRQALAQLGPEALLDEVAYTTIMERIAPELLAIPVSDGISEQDGRVTAVGELSSVFEDYLLDPTSSIQDLIESERVAELVAEPEPTPAAAKALYDLLGAAIWLGQDEQESRIHRKDEMDLRGTFSPLDYKDQTVLGDEALLPQPDESVRNRATDPLLDAIAMSDKRGTHLTPDAKILGVIPHYEAEEYLEAAIDSLLKQSRPLQGIVVIDDCSAAPPTETLARFPEVTLLRSEENSGPFRLIQEVIDNTGYDAFLFQDSDDWSAPNRLDVLLELATRSGRELIGSQGHRLIVDEGEVVPYQHPIDPEQSFQNNPRSKPVHHPTSLVTRDLIQRTGGFCTGLRFSGDTEFLRRAATVGRIANTPEFIYVYRTRSDSLTGSDETGNHTAVRRDLWAIQHPRAQWIAERAQAGLGAILAPMAVTTPVKLTHLSGPALLGVDGEAWPKGSGPAPVLPAPKKAPGRRKGAGSPPRPVFVIGAPRSGTSILALSIAQLPSFKLVLDPGWLSNLSSALHVAFSATEETEAVDDLLMQQIDTEQFAAHFGAAAHELLLQGIDPAISAPFETEQQRMLRSRVKHARSRVLAEGAALAERGFDLYRLFPHAKFIHVIRNPDEVAAAHQQDRRGLYRSRFVHMDEEQAYDRWIEVVRAARDLEVALGAEKVMRIDRAAMFDDPDAIVRSVLEFIGEPFDPVVLRPFV